MLRDNCDMQTVANILMLAAYAVVFLVLLFCWYWLTGVFGVS